MYIPTAFPCTAWRISSGTFNVLPVTLTGHHWRYTDIYLSEGGQYLYPDDLYETKAYATQGAVEKLDKSRAAMKRARARFERRQKTVARLQAEMGGPSV